MNHPQHTEFNTSTYYWYTVEAKDYDSALRHAYEQVDPALTYTLSYLAGFEIQSRFLCMYDVALRQNITDRRSPVYREVSTHSPDYEFAQQMFSAVQSDHTLRRAVHYLNQARRLWHAASITSDVEDTLRDMAILHYAKTVEAVANDTRVASGSRNNDAINQQERIVERLTKTLQGNLDLNRRVGAIEQAQTDLSRSKNRYLNLKLAVLSKDLNLGHSWLQRAKDLTKVRNRNIAHAGALLSSSERSLLFEESDGTPTVETLAERAVAAFLMKYVNDAWEGPVPAPGSSYVPKPGAAVHLEL